MAEFIEDIELDDEELIAPAPRREFLTDQQPDENGLYEHFSITVDKGQSMMRLDKYLATHIENCSRNRVQTAVDQGNVFVNDRPQKASYKIKPFDKIVLKMEYPKYNCLLTPQDIPIDIIYEDDDVIVVNKEAGMCVHPGHGNYEGTLVNALTFHLQDNPMFQQGDERAGLVHRIDKNTSGILVVGKNPAACQHLSHQFFLHSTKRRYIALVWGNFEEDEGTITGHIGRNPRNRHQMYVFADGSEGKHAVTHYKVLKRYGYVTLVECRLETGRTHQIRVHMQYMGHPLFNDERYGGDKILKGTTFSKYKQFIENCFDTMPRHALHARMLGFVHPTTGEEMIFESKTPADFQAVIDRWDNYVKSANLYNE
jgi:23S rRNA pseudouridine1911/1915/1917 synthase